MKIDFQHREFWLKEFPERAAEMDAFVDEQVKKFNELDAQELIELSYAIGDAHEVVRGVGGIFYMPSELDQRFGNDLDQDYRDSTGREMVVIGASEFWPSHVLEKLNKHEYDRQLGDWIDQHDPSLHLISNSIRDPEEISAFYVQGIDDFDLGLLRQEILNTFPQLRAAVEEQSLEANTARAPARYATDDEPWTLSAADAELFERQLANVPDGEPIVRDQAPVRSRNLRL